MNVYNQCLKTWPYLSNYTYTFVLFFLLRFARSRIGTLSTNRLKKQAFSLEVGRWNGEELTLFALVDVLGAVDTLVAAGARAGIRAVGGARVTDGVCVARVGSARVVQVTQQPCQQDATHCQTQKQSTSRYNCTCCSIVSLAGTVRGE